MDHDSDAAAVTVIRRQSDQDSKRPSSKNGINRPGSRNGKLSSSSSSTDIASDSAAEAADTAAASPTADPQKQREPTRDSPYLDGTGVPGQYQSGIPANSTADDATGVVDSQTSSNSYQTHDSSTILTNRKSNSDSSAADKIGSAGEAVDAELALSIPLVDSIQQQQPSGSSAGAW